MVRPKGSKNVQPEVAKSESVNVESVPPVGETPAPVELQETKNVQIPGITFPNNRWIYSETEEPVVLKAGTPMPAGYQISAKFEKIVWVCDDYGKFTRKDK